MGKRSSWFSTVKKALICESKQNKEKNRRSGRCFGKQKSINLDSSDAEKALVVPSVHSPPEEMKLIEAENEQNRHAYSVALVTAMAAEAAVAAANAAAEVVRLRSAVCNSSKTKEDIAAIKIQTAFRGYLGRRALRALRGVMRLKSVIGGKSAKRQAASTLKCMQTLAHVQSEIRARRIKMLEVNSAIQRQIQQKHEKELEKPRASISENWDESTRSKEQIQTDIQNRQEAAARRERALAYAYSHQQTLRNFSNSTNQTFMDPDNPRWGWGWLERWMAARPWEDVNAASKEPNTDLVSIKTSSARPVQSPTARRQSPSTPKSKYGGKIRPMSPRGTLLSTDHEDSMSMNSARSDRCRRRSSVTGSSIRDDCSSASSTAVPGYMASTECARAKSRVPSPRGLEKMGTPERASVGSAKKRLSFSGSPARPRRRLGATKTDSTA